MRLISLGRFMAVGCVLLAAVACTSGGESEDPEGTGGDAAGGDGDGDMTGDGDGDGDGDGPVGGDPDAVTCPSPTEAMILDFTYDDSGAGGAAPSMDTGSFGDYTVTFSGGTFTYGDGITSDVTGSDWHLSGTVADYSGFALFFSVTSGGCTLVDASAYSGIQLTISGDTAGNPIQINVGTAGNTISTAWFSANGGDTTPTHGRCEPATDNQYDGTCGSGTASIDVTASPTTVEIPWSSLTGATPAGSFDPAEITFIGWNFAWAGEGATPYDVDIVIDDIAFMP